MNDGIGELRLEQLITQHAHRTPAPDAIPKLEKVRRACLDLALELERLLPDCRERAVAQTKLDEVRMWACNALTSPGAGGTIAMTMYARPYPHVDTTPAPAPGNEPADPPV